MGPFIFLDIETTGRDPKRDHIMEVAAVKWENFCITERFESLVNPHVPVPYEIELLTGINGKMLEDAPAFADVRNQVFDFIGDLPIVGHNIAFDMSFLKIHINELKNQEIDTIALAKILLHKESSYALEVLMKKHGLPARGSHRAMADTETTVDFFEFLVGKIDEIDSETLGIINNVLAKSNWTGKVAFDSHVAERSKRAAVEKTHKLAKNEPAPSKNIFWKDLTLKSFADGGKIILESPAEIPFNAFKNQHLVVAYESFQKRNELVTEAQAAGLQVAVLKEPAFYLSPKKLEQKLAGESLSSEETPFLLKLILWNKTTQSGDREEISVEREEYGIFENLADNDGNDVYFKKAAKEAEKSDVVLLHHSGLALGLAKKLSGRLIILEAARLEESFTNAFRVRLTDSNLRPFFGEKATVAMGMLGIFYEHFTNVNEAGFNSNVVLDDDLRATVQWKRAMSAFENLPMG
ncbi:MAG: exonuclease domain-containing protein, partial [Patescibacteria group bacterium]